MVINKIKEIRQKKGYTQNQLCELASISIRGLQNYEGNKRIPDVHTAQRIAKALNTTIDELFPLPDETTQQK